MHRAGGARTRQVFSDALESRDGGGAGPDEGRRPSAPDRTFPPVPPLPVAFSLNRPETPTQPGDVKEIYQLYLDAIAGAERLIYIENQYLTSKDIAKALCERMEQPGRPKLDIVIVLPCDFHSWIEAAALGPAQLTEVDTVREAWQRTGHRLGLYYGAARFRQGRNSGLHSQQADDCR